MSGELDALAQRHGLRPEVVAELRRLLGRELSSQPTAVEGFASVALSVVEPPAPTMEDPTTEAQRWSDRYEDLGRLGAGGMGEVRRVRDRELNRTLAMKILHPRFLGSPAAVARFLEEAQATAQLQHPGIVPVHDVGRLPDGRLWFAMKEVRGRTLAEVIDDLHAVSQDSWETPPSGWTLRRVVSAFHAVCQAVAYAHERGVVHRDLKPHNVMVGAHGEVYVLDWGLARILGRTDLVSSIPTSDAVLSRLPAALATRVGQVAGTPAYMPPEQARGQLDRIDARTDVYALGAILYELLSGRPPYEGDAAAILRQVLVGPPDPVGRSAPTSTFGLDDPADGEATASGPPLPEELVEACERAMSRAPEERYPSAGALAEAVQAWLDGSRRREQARAVVVRAQALEAEAEAEAARAVALRAEALELQREVAAWEPEERKAAAWARADQAAAAELSAELRQLEVDETLRAALQLSPELPEAHAALAARHLARHRLAEAAGEPAARSEALLRRHTLALPEAHPARERLTAYLKGDGALTLVTDPPGAEVLLHRYVRRNRRLEAVFERSLGRTPLRRVSLPLGSYLAVLRHPGREEVRYPFEVTRQGHWDGVPPGGREPAPVWLPPAGRLGPGEVYVPAGWFRAGAHREPGTLPAMRAWCEALVVHRFPVTNREYLAFLDDLVASGREAEALRHAPRQRAGTGGELGPLVYGYEGGRFQLRPDADGDLWLPDWPVFQVDWHGARAFLAWLAERTGRPWRLPCELEWEKAARGVDGRAYPWGEELDPSWCRVADSARGRDHGDFGPVVVDSYPIDASPYGVRGLAGNVLDWCLDLYDGHPLVADGRVLVPDADAYAASHGLRSARGGTWFSQAAGVRARARNRLEPFFRGSLHGFRGAYRPAG